MTDRKHFADYKKNAHSWITLSSGEYYPDILEDAVALYTPVLEIYKKLLLSSASSDKLFLNINEIQQTWMRIQLCRVFRKYVSPSTPVEMLKRKTQAEKTIAQFGNKFRPIPEVQRAFMSRPLPDEALCAVMWEYRSRGQKGYDLTEKFFDLFASRFPNLYIQGPKRAGKDIRLGTILDEYPNPNRPVDFVIFDEDNTTILAIGLARYDSDRGGAQEDDRTGGYKNCADEILSYTKENNQNIKVVFLNDGPGLLLGSMWDDYSALEKRHPTEIMVLTLRMIPDILTLSWLRS